MKKAIIMSINGLTIISAQINGKKRILVNEETRDIIKEVNRLLGLRRCTKCGRWIKPQDASYIEIENNRVTKVICNQCVHEALNTLMLIKC